MSKKIEVMIEATEQPWVSLLADFIMAVRLDISRNYGNYITTVRQSAYKYYYDDTAMTEISEMYKSYKMMGKPIPWVKIGAIAFFGWLYSKHPGFVASTLLEKTE